MSERLINTLLVTATLGGFANSAVANESVIAPQLVAHKETPAQSTNKGSFGLSGDITGGQIAYKLPKKEAEAPSLRELDQSGGYILEEINSGGINLIKSRSGVYKNEFGQDFQTHVACNDNPNLTKTDVRGTFGFFGEIAITDSDDPKLLSIGENNLPSETSVAFKGLITEDPTVIKILNDLKLNSQELGIDIEVANCMITDGGQALIIDNLPENYVLLSMPLNDFYRKFSGKMQVRSGRDFASVQLDSNGSWAHIVFKLPETSLQDPEFATRFKLLFASRQVTPTPPVAQNNP